MLRCGFVRIGECPGILLRILHMGLTAYKQKRDFEKTPEPSGDEHGRESGKQFVVQKHAATRLHYDFRLELDGVLKSWAVPKGPCYDPREKRLAVHVEDHPVEYGSFEGIIPKGEYGGGTVMVWDNGWWEPVEDPHRGYERGKLKFRLHGRKLRGVWTLARMGKRNEQADNWLLIKHRDDEARSLEDYDVTKESPLSVVTKRDLNQITDQAKAVWSAKEGYSQSDNQTDVNEAQDLERLLMSVDKAVKADFPKEIYPQLAAAVTKPPEGDRWLHEIKYDGYRILCCKNGEEVRLLTRRGHLWNDRFAGIAQHARRLPVSDVILDGEVVILKQDGTTDFQALQNVLKGVASGTLSYFAFDCIYCKGYDLTGAALEDRKKILKKVVDSADDTAIHYSDHIKGKGDIVLKQACELGLEGIISKRADSRYLQTRSRSWAKTKCLKRQEFVIGGYTEPGGSRKGFGSLLMGYYVEDVLVFAGKVGTGYTEQTIRSMMPELAGRQIDRPAFQNPPVGREARGVHWIRPELVGEVEFNGSKAGASSGGFGSLGPTTAVSLLGKTVRYQDGIVRYDAQAGNSVEMDAFLGTNTGARVEVVDSVGQVVRTLDVTAGAGGVARVSWDGRTADGKGFAESGFYTLRMAGDNTNTGMYLFDQGNVEGVSSMDGTTYLRVNGKKVPLSTVFDIAA